MGKLPRPVFPRCVISEIVYGVSITRSGQVPLRWLDKPAKEYIVQHHEDGTIEVRPLSGRCYVIKATDADVLYLKETEAGADYLEVRHKANGTIWLRTKDQAKQHGVASDASLVSQVNPGVADDYMKVYEYVRTFLDEVVIDTRIPGYPTYPGTKKVHHIHDGWDRTTKGLGKIPRALRDLEMRESLGEQRWKEVQDEDARRREYQRAYRAKRKAKEDAKISVLPSPAQPTEARNKSKLSAFG